MYGWAAAVPAAKDVAAPVVITFKTKVPQNTGTGESARLSSSQLHYIGVPSGVDYNLSLANHSPELTRFTLLVHSQREVQTSRGICLNKVAPPIVVPMESPLHDLLASCSELQQEALISQSIYFEMWMDELNPYRGAARENLQELEDLRMQLTAAMESNNFDAIVAAYNALIDKI